MAALNLVAIAAVVWLYCLDKIAADPVAAMPGQPSSMQAPDSVEAKMPVDRLEAGISKPQHKPKPQTPNPGQTWAP